MSFKAHFLDRLQALQDRETTTFPPGTLPDDYSEAAVLLPFWATPDGRVEVVFTRRPETLSSHPGQVSFPGGRREASDDSLQQTALRETREELGINPELVTIMGRLDDAWSIAGHHVVPWVGWLEGPAEISACTEEVAEVIIADVETLLLPEVNTEHTVILDGLTRVTPAFDWDGGYVWGLSADILLEMLLWVEGRPSNRGHLRLQSIALRLHRDSR